MAKKKAGRLGSLVKHAARTVADEKSKPTSKAKAEEEKEDKVPDDDDDDDDEEEEGAEEKPAPPTKAPSTSKVKATPKAAKPEKSKASPKPAKDDDGEADEAQAAYVRWFAKNKCGLEVGDDETHEEIAERIKALANGKEDEEGAEEKHAKPAAGKPAKPAAPATEKPKQSWGQFIGEMIDGWLGTS